MLHPIHALNCGDTDKLEFLQETYFIPIHTNYIHYNLYYSKTNNGQTKTAI